MTLFCARCREGEGYAYGRLAVLLLPNGDYRVWRFPTDPAISTSDELNRSVWEHCDVPPSGPTSKQAIQKAVVEQLRQSQRPMSVRELVERIRRDRPEFKQVADFDFRSAVLAMRTSGVIESTSTNQVAVRRTDQPETW